MMCFKPMLIIKNAGQAKQREQFIELIEFLSERRIMKDDDSIESLITSTITHIKTALDSSKAGEAKVYTEMLVLLRETLSRSLEAQKRMELFDKTYSKPFEKISNKHIPDA